MRSSWVSLRKLYMNTLVNSISKVKENLIGGDNNLIQDFVEKDKSISDKIITNSENEININFDETGEDIKL